MVGSTPVGSRHSLTVNIGMGDLVREGASSHAMRGPV